MILWRKTVKISIFIILISTPDFPHFYYILGGNLGSLLYGDVSVMLYSARCCLIQWGSTGDLLLLQISSGVVWQTRDLHLSHNTLYLLSPRLCFFIVLKRDLFVYRDDSLTC